MAEADQMLIDIDKLLEAGDHLRRVSGDNPANRHWDALTERIRREWGI